MLVCCFWFCWVQRNPCMGSRRGLLASGLLLLRRGQIEVEMMKREHRLSSVVKARVRRSVDFLKF